VDERADVMVFDTTLRDGEQMPSVAFSVEEKLAIARKLEELGVDVIEAGFPVSSPEEAKAVELISKELSSTVCAIARVVPTDIRAAIATGAGMVDVFCSTSKIQMSGSMHVKPAEVLEATRTAVAMVKDAGRECMFTPMDATRTETPFLQEVCTVAQEAGADWIGLTDTVGVGTPQRVAAMVKAVAEAVDVPISIHCHDDFGLATANTLAAVEAGARMVQVCVNGLGERAGNAALEEVVMALHCLLGRRTRVRTHKLYETSRLVERLSGVAVAPNKAVVGTNAFTHESGIHAAGMLRDQRTFEPGLMTPEMVGQRRRLVVGKHAGRHGIAQALREAGLSPTEEELTEIVQRVRSVAARGKAVLSADLYAIAEGVMQKLPQQKRAIILEQLVVTTGDKITPTATVIAQVSGNRQVEAHTGVGPVDAAFRAIKRMLGPSLELEVREYHVDAVTGGSDATVRVSVSVEDNEGYAASAQSASVDIVMASVDALLTATNHLLRLRANGAGAGEKS